MNLDLANSSGSELNFIDMSTLKATEVDVLWQREVALWHERLRWDVPGNALALQRALNIGAVKGWAVRQGEHIRAYAYYHINAGRRAVISGLSALSASEDAGEALLGLILGDIRALGIPRIESPFISFDAKWLVASFEREGFQAYWREFLRVEVEMLQLELPPAVTVEVRPWKEIPLYETATLMLTAYEGSVDAEISEQYRTREGCGVVLKNLIDHRLGGQFVADASTMAFDGERCIGLTLITEISCRHAHLAQVIVHPDYQRRGIGKALLKTCMSNLREYNFESFSLIVSRSNDRARGLYQSLGFESVLAFPAFVWDR